MKHLLWLVLLVAAPYTAEEATPAPPAKATGPLSPVENKFQGSWKAYDFDSNRLEYAMTFDGREFRARVRPDEKDRDERYRGYFVVRNQTEPAQIDFVLLDDAGAPGRISHGIFRPDGETILIKAPEHGFPRPDNFKTGDSGPIVFLRLKRDS